ncbi:hypothetical protein O6H91_04G081500 [Diphasiastrum complanatum]|nr:hypothetical protein O6H91_04G081500 [Diphasiastrum complanatum]
MVIHQRQGNASFTCTVSGPCAPCSYSEKQNNDIYQCATTGYREPYKCVETLLPDSVKASSLATKKDDEQVSKQKADGTSDVKSSGQSLRHVRREGVEIVASQHGSVTGRLNNLLGFVKGRNLFEAEIVTEDGRRIYHMHRSCLPSIDKDRLSVLGFEGIMLAFLAVCGPVLYYRKKRSFLVSGMARTPSTTRF